MYKSDSPLKEMFCTYPNKPNEFTIGVRCNYHVAPTGLFVYHSLSHRVQLQHLTQGLCFAVGQFVTSFNISLKIIVCLRFDNFISFSIVYGHTTIDNDKKYVQLKCIKIWYSIPRSDESFVINLTIPKLRTPTPISLGVMTKI